MSVDEDRKFFPKVTIHYSPTLFGVKMPVLLVSFAKFPQPVQALVDSGSTNSVLHKNIASNLKLKIDYSKKREGTGVGGNFEFVFSEPIEVDILGQNFDVRFDIPLDENFAWPCILGHDSIFKFSKIQFKTYKSEFDILFRSDIN